MNEFAGKRVWGPVPHYPNVLRYQPPNYGFITMAGPCSVETPDQIKAIAKELGKRGVKYLRGGTFRAGTYPGKYFGPMLKLMEAMSAAAHENGMKCVMEVLDYSDEALRWYSKYADCFQVGARQMQNYTLLRKLGATKRLTFLKRHPGSTIDEFLGAAEHLISSGHGEVILIERGSSSHMNHVRWDLSLSMIPAVKSLTKIPIIVDASHGTGRRDLVAPMTLAGIAAGADGFLLEVHQSPELSFSDADQAYPLDEFGRLMEKVVLVRSAINSEEALN